MDTKYRKSARSRWIGGVEKLVPAVAVNRLGDLSQMNMPFGRLLESTTRAMLFLTWMQMRRAFDARLFSGEACLVCLAFWGSPLPGLAVVLAAALGFLRLRDAYNIDLENRFTRDTVKDFSLTALFMIVLEAVFLPAVAPSLVLSGGALYRGIAVATVTVTAWRTIFRMGQTPEDPERQELHQSYISTLRLTWIWLLGIGLLASAANLDGVPGFPGRDFLYGAMVPLFLALAYGLQKELPPGAGAGRKLMSLFEDPYRKDLLMWRETLWAPALNNKKSAHFPWWTVPEVLFFVWLGLPVAGQVFSLLSGNASAAQVDWLQSAAYAASLITMACLWIYIKDLHYETARALHEAAQRLK